MSVRRLCIVFLVGSLLASPFELDRSARAQDQQTPSASSGRSSTTSWTLPFQLSAEWLPFSQPKRISPAGQAATGPPQRSETVPGMLTMARMVERNGDLAKAEGMYRGILANDPTHPVALHRLGVVVARGGDYKLSAALLEKAVTASPRNAELLADLGHTYYQLEAPAESEKYLRQALQVDPTHQAARNNLAMVLAAQQRTDEALAEFRKIGTEAEAHANLSFVLRQIGEIDAANHHYETAMSMNRTLRRTVGALVWTQETKNKNTPPATVQRRPTAPSPAVKPSTTQSLVRHSRRPPPDPAPKPPKTMAIAKREAPQPKATESKPKASVPSRTALIAEKQPSATKPETAQPSAVASKPGSASPQVPHHKLDRSAVTDVSDLANLQPKYPTTSKSTTILPPPPSSAPPASAVPRARKPDIQQQYGALVAKRIKSLNARKKSQRKQDQQPESTSLATSQAAPRTSPQPVRQPVPVPIARTAAGRSPARSAPSVGNMAPIISASSYRQPFDQATASGVSFRTANIQDGDPSENQNTWLAAYRSLVQKAAQPGTKPQSEKNGKSNISDKPSAQ